MGVWMTQGIHARPVAVVFCAIASGIGMWMPSFIGIFAHHLSALRAPLQAGQRVSVWCCMGYLCSPFIIVDTRT